MTYKMKSVEKLYTNEAYLYEAISSDRDFASQIDSLIDKDSCNVLELFAGPGYHGIELLKKGHSVTMIDYSKEMREISKSKYYGVNDNNYIVDDINNAVKELHNKNDYILILRYSSGYIKDLNEMEKLLTNITPTLIRGGSIIFELHQVNLINDNLNDLRIKKREKIYNDKKLICKWPARKIKWDENYWNAEMDIEISYGESHFSYRSRERIFSTDEICYVASKVMNCDYKIITSDLFSGSYILKLIKR